MVVEHYKVKSRLWAWIWRIFWLPMRNYKGTAPVLVLLILLCGLCGLTVHWEMEKERVIIQLEEKTEQLKQTKQELEESLMRFKQCNGQLNNMPEPAADPNVSK